MTRRTWVRIGATALVAAALLGVFALAGGYNVSVTSGHLPGVATVVRWTLRNSVRLRGGGQPPAAARELPVSGAVHYDMVCRSCHGAPGVDVPESMRHMLPPPPPIDQAVRHWDSGELFWIVNHGIKMTAMPAWPARHRADEVWQVVQFLQRLPDLDAADYRRATAGLAARRNPPPQASPALQRCARCHGIDGLGPGSGSVPVIAGLSEVYLAASLEAYRQGRRASGFMQTQVAQLDSAQMRELAAHYSDQPSPLGGVPESAAAAGDWARGRRIARQGLPGQGVPACAACHGPKETPRAAGYPPLAGQRRDYLVTQLELFRSGSRGGTAFAPLMTFAARHLTDADIAALAAYYAADPPAE